MMGCLQQSSSAMGSSAIISFKPFHPSYDFGSSYRKLIPSVQASAAGKEDRGTTLSKSHEESSSSSRSSSVSSLLKAVQEGGSSVVLQQVSSIRHFFMPELPQALIREIKKRMALPFKDQDEEENSIQDDLNGGLLKEDLEEEQVILLGPRCAWPRLKLVNTEGERQEEAIQGPRCAWPRGAQALSSLQQWKQEEGLVTCRSSIEELQNGGIIISKSSQEGLERESLSKRVQEESIVNNSVIEGPRCAWPRSTPRRMLATGVGLSLVNYLLIGQGAPALAILFPITCDEESSLSSPLLQSLLP